MEDETTALEGGQQWDLAKVGARWQQELERAQRYFRSWHDRCVKIEKIYLDQQSDQTNAAKRRFPMLWANTSVLQPAVYARVPQPVVERRFKDAQPVARMASELVERNLAYMGDEADIDSIMRAVRDDFLLCVRVPLPDARFVALTSFAYNVGVKAACGSSAVRLINQGRTAEGCEALLKWNRAAGIVFPGLVRRRQKERQFCLEGI